MQIESTTQPLMEAFRWPSVSLVYQQVHVGAIRQLLQGRNSPLKGRTTEWGRERRRSGPTAVTLASGDREFAYDLRGRRHRGAHDDATRTTTPCDSEAHDDTMRDTEAHADTVRDAEALDDTVRDTEAHEHDDTEAHGEDNDAHDGHAHDDTVRDTRDTDARDDSREAALQDVAPIWT
mmetsp:Transcript_26033/g.60008  ORF Transcript_26033/g.60008 Transcript_26033/m.60008 type:complete len:178 (+) Transcript_26033:894-1427(+)